MRKLSATLALAAMLAMSFALPITTALAADPKPAASASPAPPPAPAVEAAKSEAEKALNEADKKVEAAKEAVAAVPTDDLPAGDFLSQVLAAIKQFGGLPTVGKIALIIALLISSMKVSVLNQLLWSKLGAAKVWVAPLLGLIAGILDLANSGQVTLASVFAYISAGAGAIILHELLDSVKKIPKLGELWVKVIEIVQRALKGPEPKSKA